MLILAVLSSLAFINWTAPRAGISPKKAFDLAFWLFVVGLLGSRAAYVITHIKYFSYQPLNSLKYWEGGLMFQGGLVAGLGLVMVLAALGRFHFLVMADAISPPLALGQAIGRVGCFLVGCCHGRLAPDWLPLTLTFPHGSLAPPGFPLYPTQVMESVGLFLITLLLMYLLGRTRPAGLIFAVYLSLAGLLRFAIDFFRGDNRGPAAFGLPPTSWAALAIFLSGLALSIFLLVRQKKRSAKYRLLAQQ
jgi:phosphatidylglycerol:prolipoprotein diacylglycerol transferase